jgi:hypothetical protein
LYIFLCRHESRFFFGFGFAFSLFAVFGSAHFRHLFGPGIDIHFIWLFIIGFGLRWHGIRFGIVGLPRVSTLFLLDCRLAGASRLRGPATGQQFWVLGLGLGMHSQLAWEMDSELGLELGQIVNRY